MNTDIQNYNDKQTRADKEISENLPQAENKIWHILSVFWMGIRLLVNEDGFVFQYIVVNLVYFDRK